MLRAALAAAFMVTGCLLGVRAACPPTMALVFMGGIKTTSTAGGGSNTVNTAVAVNWRSGAV